MNQSMYSYQRMKMYIRFAVLVNALFIILLAFLTTKQWHFVYIVLYVIAIIALIIYIVFRVKQIRKLDYFIKWDEQGVYTYESFLFCAWDDIKSISLRRYMGYQTLFFEIATTLDAKISPIRQDNKQYYCLPLADCKGQPQVIIETLLLAYHSKKS